MFDIKWIRDNPDDFDTGIARRGLEPASGGLIELDKVRRAAETRAIPNSGRGPDYCRG